MEIALLVAFAFVLAVFVVGTILTIRASIRVFRDVSSLLRAVSGGMETLAQRLARVGESTARATERPADLHEAFTRLSTSRVCLRVLTSALARVRAEAGGITGLYPRK